MTEKKLATDNQKKAPKIDPATAQPKTKTSWLSILAIVCFAALAGAGYFAYNLLEKRINANQATNLAGQQATATLSAHYQTHNKTVADSLKGLSSEQQQLEQTLSDKIRLLQSQVQKSKRQWLIAEAEYLVSIANNQLYLANNVSTAISALEAADYRLAENAGAKILPVRQQIAIEILALKQLQLPDILGLSTQLLALESSVSTMVISTPYAGKAQHANIAKQGSSAMPENIQQTLDDAWENFSKLIVVRRNSQPMAVLMTPEQVELIRKNLALKIEAARLALIQKNEALYLANLSITAQWLSDYFDASNPAVMVAIKQINLLKNSSISVALPDISRSLELLRELPLSPLLVEQATSQPAKTLASSTSNIKPAPTTLAAELRLEAAQ